MSHASAMLYEMLSRHELLDEYRDAYGLMLSEAEMLDHPSGGTAWRIVLRRGADERGFIITPLCLARGEFPDFFQRAIEAMCPEPPPRRTLH